MVLKSDQQRIKTLLQEAIPLLCKNGLSYQSEFCIEALIGITLDKNDVFLVNINERVCSVEKSSSSAFHEETRIECGGTGDAQSVEFSDSVSDNEGRDNVKTVQKFRNASQSLFRKQTRDKACARGSGDNISDSKGFDRCSNDGISSERRRVNETEAHSDFADSYEVSVNDDLGSPPLKKQACEWGSSTQTYIKQEPDFCEIIDPSDNELDDNDVKDQKTFSAVPTMSENTAGSSADMYSVYGPGLDVLQAPSTVPSATPGGSGVVTSYGGTVLNRSSSLAQALPELSMTSPSVAGQSAVGYGLPSYTAHQSQVSIILSTIFLRMQVLFLLSTANLFLPSNVVHYWRPIINYASSIMVYCKILLNCSSLISTNTSTLFIIYFILNVL